jgi:hypothetical protein
MSREGTRRITETCARVLRERFGAQAVCVVGSASWRWWSGREADRAGHTAPGEGGGPRGPVPGGRGTGAMPFGSAIRVCPKAPGSRTEVVRLLMA